MRGPSFTYASETNNASTSTSSFLCCALAMADCSTFSTVGAMRLLAARSVFNAAPAFCPRIRSTTRRAFCAETRIYLASALACMPVSLFFLRRLPGLLGRGLDRVALERPGGRELAQLVPHHVLGHVHGNELLPV